MAHAAFPFPRGAQEPGNKNRKKPAYTVVGNLGYNAAWCPPLHTVGAIHELPLHQLAGAAVECWASCLSPTYERVSVIPNPHNLVEIPAAVQVVAHRALVLEGLKFVQIDVDDQCHLGIGGGLRHDGVVGKGEVRG